MAAAMGLATLPNIPDPVEINASAVKPDRHKVDSITGEEGRQAPHLTGFGLVESVERMSSRQPLAKVACGDGANLDHDSRVVDLGYHVDLTCLELDVARDDASTVTREEIDCQIFG
jgi:hypothetical protein